MHFRVSLTYFFVGLAIVVAILSLLWSNRLVGELKREERRKMELWAKATESMATDGDVDMELVLHILEGNTSIPMILYDEKAGSLTPRNIKTPLGKGGHALQATMEAFAARHEPIVLKEVGQLLYYDDSHTLKMLQRFPYLQLLVIALFVGLAFFALNRSQRAQRDRVWVGLSKETAHQLGTPISSLVAWVEYMGLKGVDRQMLGEMDKDVSRLRTIAERFSKIGSVSRPVEVDLREVVWRSLEYLGKRVSGEVEFCCRFPEHPVWVPLDEPLFGWVIENLVKNAVDAMQGKGRIVFEISEKGRQVFLDVSDSGRGIAKSKFNTVFSAGYTTRERGWGLGLTLVKRIVEENHKGRILVKESEPGVGTTFRILLEKRQ